MNLVQTAEPISGPPEELQLARWTTRIKRSLLRQMIAIVSQPGILSFAGGLPDPALFPRAQYAEATAQVLASDPLALQYRPPFEPLKERIVELMAQRSVLCQPQQIFVTTGAQQGLQLLAQLLLNPGQAVAIESFVYTGAQQAVNSLNPRWMTVETCLTDGMDVVSLAKHLENQPRPAFIYAIPEAHNPIGVSLGQGKRQQLLSLALEHHVPIIEDDPYGFLSYDGPPSRPLRADDAQWVFYVGSFSKIMAPALRLGWIVAPPQLIDRLTVIKEAGDLETSALTQRAVATYLAGGDFPAHLERLRAAYRARRDAMLQALERHFPDDARWTSPRAGMFIWVELADGIDTMALLDSAVTEEKVAYIPGGAFAIDPLRGGNCLRLNFSTCTPDMIAEGIHRLSRVIRRAKQIR